MELEILIGEFSWKDRGVGKFDMTLKRMNFESSDRSWLVQPKLEKFKINLERINEVGKILFKLGRSIKVNGIRKNQFWHNFVASLLIMKFSSPVTLSNFGDNFPSSF